MQYALSFSWFLCNGKWFKLQTALNTLFLCFRSDIKSLHGLKMGKRPRLPSAYMALVNMMSLPHSTHKKVNGAIGSQTASMVLIYMLGFKLIRGYMIAKSVMHGHRRQSYLASVHQHHCAFTCTTSYWFETKTCAWVAWKGHIWQCNRWEHNKVPLQHLYC